MPASNAVPSSAVARVLGVKTDFKDLRGGNVAFLPQRVAVVGQGSSASVYSTDKAQHTSALSVGQTYGFGSPLHLAALQLLPANGDGIGAIPMTIYPLVDDGGGAVAAGDITPGGAQTEEVDGCGQRASFTLPSFTPPKFYAPLGLAALLSLLAVPAQAEVSAETQYVLNSFSFLMTGALDDLIKN